MDHHSRQNLYHELAQFSGTALIISHDLELLERAEHTFELHKNELHMYGGNYAHYRHQLEVMQHKAQQNLRDAEQDLRAQKKRWAEINIKLSRRTRTAKKAQQESRVPKILAGRRKSNAQVSAGKLRGIQESLLNETEQTLSQLDGEIRDERKIRLELGVPELASATQVITDTKLRLLGPERVGLVGRNGTGKTTLIEQLIKENRVDVPYAYIPQKLAFPPQISLVNFLRQMHPELELQTLRAQLAKLLFRGESGNQRTEELSGGEKFRFALAAATLKNPVLLILDEPTNSLDIETVELLLLALQDWRGALLVTSHDKNFLDRLGLDRCVDLDRLNLR